MAVCGACGPTAGHNMCLKKKWRDRPGPTHGLACLLQRPPPRALLHRRLLVSMRTGKGSCAEAIAGEMGRPWLCWRGQDRVESACAHRLLPGAWRGLAGPGGAWWGLVGPGGAWPPRRGHCGWPWWFLPPATEEAEGGGGPVRGSLRSGTVPGWCPALGWHGRGCPANGIRFRGSHPAQPDLCCPLEMCGRFISTNFLSTKCI